ncbi:hypothetical protein HMPREF0758_3548 [Serratia odorifera DSM 4582]|uniref:Uncharacterized protein n=1 Tax=Serratia odorifera DSM 4582 TaxID=667129 RepID=D4E5U8_SEROD|nr:hypothetical protein HMPREF0758_3548 [Serratia odorifera DSM 4582]
MAMKVVQRKCGGLRVTVSQKKYPAMAWAVIIASIAGWTEIYSVPTPAGYTGGGREKTDGANTLCKKRVDIATSNQLTSTQVHGNGRVEYPVG